MFIKIKPVVGGLTDKEKRTIVFAAKELSKHLLMVDAFGDFPVIPVTEYKEKDCCLATVLFFFYISGLKQGMNSSLNRFAL